jgi:hypothetical protein
MVVIGSFCVYSWLHGQEPASSEQPAAEPPPMPKGVEVMARGPIHEAFASPTTDPVPGQTIPKQPPKPINEVPPEDKPAGDVVWIGGYWAWDDDRNDFLWVSGIWRTVPPGKQWVAGYWREDAGKWQWVNGFWAEATKEEEATKPVTYLPAPPKPPEVAPPGQAPNPESFYVPGTWIWNGDSYAWRAGYWARVQPGYVWVPAHFRWTPSGYLFIGGYWDLAVARRGFLYAPVVVDCAVVGPTFVYTPAYAVTDTVVLDALFIRPCCCHYYFGDYYGVRYRSWGFESCVVYSRTHYDGIIAYECYERRSDPAWLSIQIDLCGRRDRGLAACPPRTLVQQTVIQQNVTNVVNNTTIVNNNVNNTRINNNTVNNNINKNVVNNTKNVYQAPALMPASKLAAAKGIQTVKLNQAARNQALQRSQAVQQVAQQRSKLETASPGVPSRPRQAALRVPPVQPVRGANEKPPATRPNTGAAARPGTTGPRNNPTYNPRGGNSAPRTNAGAARPGNSFAPNTRYNPGSGNSGAPRYGRPGGTPPRYGQPQRPGMGPQRPGMNRPMQRPAPPARRSPPPRDRQPNNGRP